MEKYIIKINTNKESRFIDEFDSERGTCFENIAKQFSTKEEAQSFINECEYINCHILKYQES